MLAVFIGTDLLWRNAIIAIPIAMIVAILCRCMPSRPATRHLLWLVVLAVLFAPPAIPAFRIALTSKTSAVSTSPAEDLGVVSAPARVAPAPADDRSPIAHTASISPQPAPKQSPRPILAPKPSKFAGKPIQNPILNQPSTLREAVPTVPLFEQAQNEAQPKSWLAPALAEPKRDVESTLASRPPKASTLSPRPSKEIDIPRDSPSIATKKEALTQPPIVARNPEPSAFSIPWSLWAERLQALFRAVAALPAFPPVLWLAGSLLLALIAAARLIQHRSLFHGSTPAPRDVADEVHQASQRIGLAHAPHTLMVRGRLSPMIWCGRRPVLVLPVELWDELDVVGRRAVIHHELAHLKRRDHWVCWAELIAMAIYWWNPLVWWVRRRIREEADLCCDAWVTTLFPHGRRAYAQALLNTRRFISDSSSARPDVGLGAISSGARHFARRLTMVMTHRPTPSRTLPGIFLAATIAAAGFLAAPLVACPPEDEKEQAAKEVAAKEKARNKVAVAGQPVAPVPSAAPRAAQAPRTPKPPKAPRATLAPQTTTPAPAAAVTVPATPAPPDQWSAGAPEAAARAYVDESRARERAAAAPRYPTPRGGVSAPQGGADLKQMQQRIDQLDRRLDEMNRRLDQVLRRLEMRGEADPVEMNQAITTTGSFNPLFATIASTGDGDDQRAIVILLGPGDKVEAFKVRQGNMGALTSLLSESGDPLSAKVYAHAEAERALVARKLDLDRFQEQISRAHVDARDQALAAERAVLAQNHAALAELHQHVDQHRQAADRLREKAEQLAERSESMQERIAELMERAEQTEGAERKASLKQVEVLRAQIEALQNAAEKLQEQAEELAEHAGDLSDEAMEMIDESAEEAAEEPDENPSAEPMVIAPLMPEPPVKPTPAVRPN